jgi:hypothetical protein
VKIPLREWTHVKVNFRCKNQSEAEHLERFWDCNLTQNSDFSNGPISIRLHICTLLLILSSQNGHPNSAIRSRDGFSSHLLLVEASSKDDKQSLSLASKFHGSHRFAIECLCLSCRWYSMFIFWLICAGPQVELKPLLIELTKFACNLNSNSMFSHGTISKRLHICTLRLIF